jgi:hypothetical protein
MPLVADGDPILQSLPGFRGIEGGIVFIDLYRHPMAAPQQSHLAVIDS